MRFSLSPLIVIPMLFYLNYDIFYYFKAFYL